MEYSIKLNAVDNPKEKVKAFASVTLGDSFKISRREGKGTVRVHAVF